MPTVTMTVEEYLELIQADKRSPREQRRLRRAVETGSADRKPKKKGKAAKGMSRAMKEANDRLRTKSGKLRKIKGKQATQADVARLAHKIRRQKYA